MHTPKEHSINFKSQKKGLLFLAIPLFSMYPEPGSNRHGRNGHRILSPACLPIPPPGQLVHSKLTLRRHFHKKILSEKRTLSGRRDSNPRPRPWQGRALPAELLSRCYFLRTFVVRLGLEPRLFCTKNRRVASYTIGQFL